MTIARFIVFRILGMVVVLMAVPLAPAIVNFFQPGGTNSQLLSQFQPLGVRMDALGQGLMAAEQHVLILFPLPSGSILYGLGVSLFLVFASIALAAAVGMPLGIYAAVKKKHWFRHIGPLGGLVAQAIPTYLMASLLQLNFAILWHVFPVGGWHSPASAVLPIVSLAAGNVGYIAKFTQAGMNEAMQQDYIISAKARGLPGWKLVLRHALRPASIAMITFFGPQSAMLINNTLLLQVMFYLPGISSVLGESMSGGIQGVPQPFGASGDTVLAFFLLAFIVLTLNLIIDVVQRLLDPRVA